MADFLSTPVFVWLAFMIVFLIAEMVTVGLVSIWFAGGAFAALVLAAAGSSEVLQVIAFFAVSVVLLLFTRPFVRKYVKPHMIKTNYEMMVGKEVRVTERIDNRAGTGTAVCNGMEWSVKSTDYDTVIEAGESAYVTEIKGVTLYVKSCAAQKQEIRSS